MVAAKPIHLLINELYHKRVQEIRIHDPHSCYFIPVKNDEKEESAFVPIQRLILKLMDECGKKLDQNGISAD